MGQPYIVGILKCDQLGTAGGEAQISRRGLSTIAVQSDIADARVINTCNDGLRAVGGTVVNHDELKVSMALIKNASIRARQ